MADIDTPLRSQPVPRILVVDDEPGILSALRRELQSIDGGTAFAVELFTEPRQALARAQVQEFAAVLSDYRMPEMNGLEFLKALYAIQPDCERIVLSGRTDFATLARMVNETHIFRFIAKPWERDYLAASLGQALAFRAARLEHRRLTTGATSDDLVREPGVADRILLLGSRDVTNAMARCLGEHNRLDDLYAEMLWSSSEPGIDQRLHDIDVQVSDSLEQAMDLACRPGQRFSCLVADCGADASARERFFDAYAAAQPDCAVVLVSAEPGFLGLARAVPHFFGLLLMPWDDFELRAIVAQALAHRRLQLANQSLSPRLEGRPGP